MSARPLLYYSAHGPYYRDLTALSVRSARKHGYRGDIIVLSDVPAQIPDARVVVVPDLDRYFGKASLPAAVDLSAYDRVLFLDCDILLLAPFESLFSRAGQLLVTCEFRPMAEANHFHTLYLSDAELRACAEQPCPNGGVLAMDASAVAGFYDAMQRKLDSRPDIRSQQHTRAAHDQCALTSLIYVERWPFAFYDSGVVWFPGHEQLGPRTATSVAAHFIAGGRGKLFAMLAALGETYRPPQSPGVLAGIEDRLAGPWSVQVLNYKAVWRLTDGVVRLGNSDIVIGHYHIMSDHVLILGNDRDTWDSFSFPILERVVGDTWRGEKTLEATHL